MTLLARCAAGLVLIALLAAPAFGFALEPIVPCGNDEDGSGKVDANEECTFGDFIEGIERLINLAVLVSAALAALAFTWAGLLYLTAAGNVEQVKRAHGIFKKVALGFIIVLSAWLVVYTIVKTLLPEDREDEFHFLEERS